MKRLGLGVTAALSLVGCAGYPTTASAPEVTVRGAVVEAGYHALAVRRPYKLAYLEKIHVSVVKQVAGQADEEVISQDLTPQDTNDDRLAEWPELSFSHLKLNARYVVTLSAYQRDARFANGTLDTHEADDGDGQPVDDGLVRVDTGDAACVTTVDTPSALTGGESAITVTEGFKLKLRSQTGADGFDGTADGGLDVTEGTLEDATADDETLL